MQQTALPCDKTANACPESGVAPRATVAAAVEASRTLAARAGLGCGSCWPHWSCYARAQPVFGGSSGSRLLT
ncbi:protein of unknown function [Desulfovibrio sp. 86]|nr:protein of unknown function [Desulfovibrio sp. 86]